MDQTESAADALRNQGIVVTFAQNAKKIHRNVRDISVSNLTMLLYGTPLVDDTELTLNYGNRYGFIGRNGCGKSTFMKIIAARCFPIPEGIDIYHVSEEIEASDMTAKEAVMSVDKERAKLEREADELNDLLLDDSCEDHDEIVDRVSQIYERLEEMDAATAEARAAKILSGLGFTPEKQRKKTREFSGGWRMRIALARALFIQPTLLLLDEPTNHLDMEAVVWLEDYLSKWNKILFLVSHSQDFLNSVCTHMVNLKNKQLVYYTGNYDMFVQTKRELEEEQNRKFKSEQDQIKQMKDYIARFGHGTAKNAKQAQSKEKVLDKMVRGGLTEKVETEKPLDFKFLDPGKLAPPVLQLNDISFGYPGCEILYDRVDLGVDLESRVALVGPNGAGKSTLLKIMTGELIPVTGAVRPHTNLRISKFSQHFVDVLDLTLTPLDYFMQLWPEMTREDCRKFLGRYGISGAVQTQIMGQLSDGQKSRVVLAKMARENPHMLFLDEPTNHLDMESIDSLAKAINGFEGGVILVSHDMRLISQVAKEIWMCDNRKVTKFAGEIGDFKMQLRRQMQQTNLIDQDSRPVAFAPPAAPKDAFPALDSAKEPAASGKAKSGGGLSVWNGGSSAAAESKPSAAESEMDAVMKSRMELAELAIQKQRARKAAEEKPAASEGPSSAAAAVAVSASARDNESEAGTSQADESSSAMTEKERDRERKKLQRQAEKEAAAAREKALEEDRQRRRAEKLKDMEDARILKEHEDRAREERQRERDAKNAKRKAEEDAAAAELAAAKAKRREEKEQRRREREARREAEEEARRRAWDEAARADPWTQEQQEKLEDALLRWDPFAPAAEAGGASRYGSMTADEEKVAKWAFVASAVEGKTRNQCLSRYRFLKQLVQDMKKEIVVPENP
jgi:ATP-binding cassette subfamily F protein 2